MNIRLGCWGVGAPFTGVSSHKTVYFPPFKSILQWEVHNNIIHSMPGDEFFFLSHHKSLYSRVSTGKQGIFQWDVESLST